jgi:hypothetical protein
MPSLYLRPPVAVIVAATARASACGISRQQWILGGLDIAADLQSPPRAFGIEAPLRAIRLPAARSGRIKIDLAEDQFGAYQVAARACHLPVATWASIVLGVLTGVSNLKNQLDRCR